MADIDSKEKKNEEMDSDLDPLILMDEILDKLKLLDYEILFTKTKGHRPLSRSYFALKSTNQGEQSVYFNSLAIWLLTLCGANISGDKKYDDPTTIANTLLMEMKNIGIQCDIPPNKLRTGYGESVCIILQKLVDKALEKKKPNIKKIKIEKEKDHGNDDDLIEIEEESPEAINKDIDFGDKAQDTLIMNDINENKQEIVSNILASDIPAEEWQRELEKVSSKLKIDYSNTFNSIEWRSHIDQIKTNETNFSKTIPDARGILEVLSQDIDKSLEKISKKESMLSKNFTNIISNYKERNKETHDQLEEYNKLRERSEKLQRELDEIDERISQNTSKFENMSKSISDTTSISKIKQAIQKLNTEIISQEMKIQILNHTILKNKLSNLQGYSHKDNEGLDTSMFDELL